MSLGIECLNGVADGLIVAAKNLGNQAGRLATGTGQQDLTAAQYKSIGRPQPRLQGLPFVLGQWTDINGFPHTQEYATSPNTSRETALGRVCKLRPEPDRGDEPHRLIVGSPLLSSCGNTPELFKPIDQARDGIPRAIERPNTRSWPALTPLAGNGEAEPRRPQVLPARPTAIALITNKPDRVSLGAPWSVAFHRALPPEGHTDGGRVALPRGQETGHGLTVTLGA